MLFRSHLSAILTEVTGQAGCDLALWISQALHAFWAWSQANRCFAPRDGSVLDVTSKVNEAFLVLQSLFAGRAQAERCLAWLEAGQALEASEGVPFNPSQC